MTDEQLIALMASVIVAGMEANPAAEVDVGKAIMLAGDIIHKLDRMRERDS